MTHQQLYLSYEFRFSVELLVDFISKLKLRGKIITFKKLKKLSFIKLLTP